jgi:hypothetical protein
MSQPSCDWFSEQTLEFVAERSLFLKLYLEKGVIKPWRHQFSEECQKHYPEDYSKLHELKKQSGYARDEALSREAFRLLKGMANNTHHSISTSNTLDNLFKLA